MDPLQLEAHRLPQYRNFATRYGIEDFERFVALYDIDDLEAFLPESPSESEKKILAALIGVEGVKGYMDWVKSNHTMELILQWQEITGNYSRNIRFYDLGGEV
jgi:hypothetical protein